MNKIAVSDLIFFNDTKEDILNFLEENDINNLEFFLEFDDPTQSEKVDYILRYKELSSISFHGPYRYFNLDCEPSTWVETKDKFVEAIYYTKKYKGDFLVLHTNEAIKPTSNKEDIEGYLDELIEISKKENINLLLENVGVGKNMIYSEEDFIQLVQRKNLNVLIDIGHLLANKWSLENVLLTLKDNIKAFHLHNNDGEQDLHYSFFNGYFNGEEIAKLIKKITPTATLVLEYSPLTPKEELLNDLKNLNHLL